MKKNYAKKPLTIKANKYDPQMDIQATIKQEQHLISNSKGGENNIYEETQKFKIWLDKNCYEDKTPAQLVSYVLQLGKCPCKHKERPDPTGST